MTPGIRPYARCQGSSGSTRLEQSIGSRKTISFVLYHSSFFCRDILIVQELSTDVDTEWCVTTRSATGASSSRHAMNYLAAVREKESMHLLAYRLLYLQLLWGMQVAFALWPAAYPPGKRSFTVVAEPSVVHGQGGTLQTVAPAIPVRMIPVFNSAQLWTSVPLATGFCLHSLRLLGGTH